MILIFHLVSEKYRTLVHSASLTLCGNMNGAQVATVILMFLGFMLTCIAVGIPYWEKSDPSDTVNDNIVNVSTPNGKFVY